MADVVARGLRFHVQRLGAGDRTVVFLHGLVMDNLSSWYFTLANRAAASADVILYDLRGHGASERPASGYSLDEMVADLDALLTTLRVTRPVQLVGNSFGGLVALKFAAAHAARTRSLALIDSHLSDTGWGAGMSATLSLSGVERDQKIAESFQHWLGRNSTRKRNRLVQTAEALVHGTTLADDLRASSPMTDEDLRRVNCPVVAVYGERSDVRPNGARLSRALPHCELRIIPGCTHSVLWEATDTVRHEVLEWLGRS